MEDNKEEIVKSEKKQSKAPYFLLGLCVGLLFGLLILATNIYFMRFGTSANGALGIYKKSSDLLSKEVTYKINLINEFVDRYYLEEADNDKKAEGIYRGIIESLDDPYSTYYNAEELEKIHQSNQGMFYGVGLSLRQESDTMYIFVNEVIEDTPADGSGIEPDDMLYAVDDEVIVGQTLSDVVMKVKGELGTEVKLTMYRDGEYMDYEFKRGEVKNDTVQFEVKDDEIGYLRITSFEKVTYEQFIDAITEAKEKEVKGLIIDLRGNPGGDLSTVAKIADLLLPEGMIVYTEDKVGAKEEFKSDAGMLYDGPLVLLVDSASASASEILAGAIKDYHVGTLVGTQTFGKGIVQRVLSLGDGTALKLTISNYFTPSGNNIHKIGIEPDVVVEFDTDAYLKDHTDNQLDKAMEILKKK